MRWKVRFISAIVVVLIGTPLFKLFLLSRTPQNPPIDGKTSRTTKPESSFDFASRLDSLPSYETIAEPERTSRASSRTTPCTMRSCFDYNRCKNGFRIFVYPQAPGEKVSTLYAKILRVLRESKYYTLDPKRACLFVPSIDTLDRDRLSPDYVHNIGQKIARLAYWNGDGSNHLLFSVYAGTWPDYSDRLDFDTGRAIVARASVSMTTFRAGFDVSIPLVSKVHALKGGRGDGDGLKLFPIHKKYLLAFKGKRYLTGIGSETRNGLSLIHNGDDVVLVTTCRHGNNWEQNKDERCDSDQENFEKFDFVDLLRHSTFCLVPRGRRLGSYRFLETVEANCIPVSLSNGYVMPFSEKIDWNRAVLNIDERVLLQLPYIVRNVPNNQIIAMRQQLEFLWDTYFSSIEKVIGTTIEILFDRIHPHLSRSHTAWNHPPGALALDPTYSPHLTSFPFYAPLGQSKPSPNFTAVITAYTPIASRSAPLFNLIREIGKSPSLTKILILWMCDEMPPNPSSWPGIAASTDVEVLTGKERVVSSRFNVAQKVHTDAILSLDEDAIIIRDEIDFALSVWRDFPDRIVGFPARNHVWDADKSRWGYTSKWMNEYSMVLTGAAFLHKYYAHLYTNHLPASIRNLVDQTSNCDDIAMNFLVSHVTKRPPIKVTQKKKYYVTAAAHGGGGGGGSDPQPQSQRMTMWMSPTHFSQRQACINMFYSVFGYMPLVSSQLRLDPILFKDPVAMLKKRYRRLETSE